MYCILVFKIAFEASDSDFIIRLLFPLPIYFSCDRLTFPVNGLVPHGIANRRFLDLLCFAHEKEVPVHTLTMHLKESGNLSISEFGM